MYDIYTCLEDGPAVGLTDGLAEVDMKGHAAHHTGWKSCREQAFPLGTVKDALCTKLQQANASKEADRRRILNTIIRSNNLGDTPPEEHPNYDVLNSTLAGRFAAAGWRNAMEAGDSMEDFIIALSGSSQRSVSFSLAEHERRLDIEGLVCALPTKFLEDLALDFFATRFSSEDLRLLMADLPVGLRHLKLDFGKCQGLTTLHGLGAGLARLRHLTTCEMYFGECRALCVAEGLSCEHFLLPALHTFTLNFDDCSGIRTVEGIGQLLRGLPAVQKLTLDFSGCTRLTTLDELVTALIARKYEAVFQLNLERCTSLASKRLLRQFLCLSDFLTAYRRAQVANEQGRSICVRLGI